MLASPSWENTATHVTQDYVYHWTRDAAVVALELAWAYSDGTLPDNQPLIDYVLFSRACQRSARRLRPGLLLHRRRASARGPTRPTAPRCRRSPCSPCTASWTRRPRRSRLQLIDANLDFLQGAYQGQTYNLWEEEYGYSFFARSAQLRCFQAVAANTIGITVPAGCRTR